MKELVSRTRDEFFRTYGQPSGPPLRMLQMKARWDFEAVQDAEAKTGVATSVLESEIIDCICAEAMAEWSRDRFITALCRQDNEHRNLLLDGHVAQEFFDELERIADARDAEHIWCPLEHAELLSKGNLNRSIVYMPHSRAGEPLFIGSKGWSTYVGEQILIPQRPIIDPSTFTPFLSFKTDVTFRCDPALFTTVHLGNYIGTFL